MDLPSAGGSHLLQRYSLQRRQRAGQLRPHEEGALRVLLLRHEHRHHLPRPGLLREDRRLHRGAHALRGPAPAGLHHGQLRLRHLRALLLRRGRHLRRLPHRHRPLRGDRERAGPVLRHRAQRQLLGHPRHRQDLPLQGHPRRRDPLHRPAGRRGPGPVRSGRHLPLPGRGDRRRSGLQRVGGRLRHHPLPQRQRRRLPLQRRAHAGGPVPAAGPPDHHRQLLQRLRPRRRRLPELHLRLLPRAARAARPGAGRRADPRGGGRPGGGAAVPAARRGRQPLSLPGGGRVHPVPAGEHRGHSHQGQHPADGLGPLQGGDGGGQLQPVPQDPGPALRQPLLPVQGLYVHRGRHQHQLRPGLPQ